MKTKINFSVLLLAICIMFCSFGSVVHADNEGLRYSSISDADLSAYVSASGLLSLEASYTGYSGITTGAKITTYVQKKTLGLFWIKVNNGQANNEWVDNLSGSSNDADHSLQLSSTGTYRVTASYTIYATSGNESFTLQRTVTY